MKIDFEQKVNDIITQQVSPLLRQHGGDIKIKKIEAGNVWVVFEGSCKTCPSAQITIEETVDKILREELGEELKEVFLTNETNEELLNFAKQILNGSKK